MLTSSIVDKLQPGWYKIDAKQVVRPSQYLVLLLAHHKFIHAAEPILGIVLHHQHQYLSALVQGRTHHPALLGNLLQ